MPGVKAAGKIAGNVAGRGSSTAAGAASTPKRHHTPADLPRDPGAHAAKLRGQGRNDGEIRRALTDMGYSKADAANVAPGAAPPAPAPSTTSTPSTPSTTSTPAAEPPTPPTPAAPPPLWSPPTIDAGGPAGFILGIIGTAALINFMHGGPAQVRAWLGAKLLNNAVAAPTPGGDGKTGIPAKPLPGGGAPKFNPPGAGAGGGGGGSW